MESLRAAWTKKMKVEAKARSTSWMEEELTWNWWSLGHQNVVALISNGGDVEWAVQYNGKKRA